MRVLVIEDEEKIADLIKDRLKKEKYDVDISLDGEDGSYNALTNIYDLIILDVMLPYKDGFEILEEIKENDIKSKILMLTARGEIDDKLTGLTGGADDYLTKPFHMDELVARVNIQLRKDTSVKNKDYIEFGDIKLNIKSSYVSSNITGEQIELIHKEFQILELLINNKNQIVSKEIIYDNIWGIDNDSISNNLEAYISFIRKKLKSIGSKVNIKALRGIGYRLEVTNEESEE